MGKKTEILFNSEILQEIADAYKESVTIIQEISNYNATASTGFSNNYEGQAKEMTVAKFDKISEHLTLLETCCQSMQEYIQNAWDTMNEADKSVSEGKRIVEG
ncbi:WXG100 family type VII secretion target [Anaerosporobacter sp.]